MVCVACGGQLLGRKCGLCCLVPTGHALLMWLEFWLFETPPPEAAAAAAASLILACCTMPSPGHASFLPCRHARRRGSCHGRPVRPPACGILQAAGGTAGQPGLGRRPVEMGGELECGCVCRGIGGTLAGRPACSLARHGNAHTAKELSTLQTCRILTARHALLSLSFPLHCQIGEGAAHTEAAWAERLPHALPFLLQPWWAGVAERHSGDLFFTSPHKLQAGQPAVLFVQKARSDSLAGSPGPLHAHIGFNGWQVGRAELQLQPAPQLEAAAGAAQGSSGASSSDSSSGASSNGSSSSSTSGSSGSTEEPVWWSASFVVPEEAYETQFVLTDGRGKWDNNAGGLGCLGRAGC